MAEYGSVIKDHCVTIFLAYVAFVFLRKLPSRSCISFEKFIFGFIIFDSLIED